MKRTVLSSLALSAVVLGACLPDPGSSPAATAADTTTPTTAATTTSPPASTTTSTTTASPAPELSGVSLGFNNAEQGVIAPDGTPLLVVMRLDSVEVVRGLGAGTELVRAGGGGRVATAAIAAGPSRVVVAWVESGGGVDPLVKAAVSEDSGRSFGPEQELGRGGGPSLAAAGEDIVAVWHTGREGEPNGDVVISRLPAGVSAWGPAAPVDASASAPLWASVDARGSTLVVAWRDDRTGRYTVWMRASPDLGATWEPEVQVATVDSGDPDVCLDSAGTIWLGYHSRGNVLLTSSDDGGRSFLPSERVGDGWFAHLACDTGVVAVAWEETTAPPKAPEADKAAGWATYTSDLAPLARGSEGAPTAVAATVVPVADGTLDLVWLDADPADGTGALSGSLRRISLPLPG